ncbi:MAG: SsrA-binding protein SmpB [Alphaproteobacteria bacterium]|nr:SsrA-binding protein SmpB [Alphaproteobacteria bacterium]MCB9974067.1 SsrA-binding protein SmpB [Rhodospirillales bacterium]
MISTNAVVAENKKARFDYELLERFEAGIMLSGSEVKSLRLGQCSIKESYVGPKGGEIWLWGANIAEYRQAGPHLQHEPTRPRKLLLHKKEIHKLMGAVAKQGLTIVATKLYFDKNGRAKIEIALAKGKKKHDKRETEKNRDWARQKQSLLRNKG